MRLLLSLLLLSILLGGCKPSTSAGKAPAKERAAAKEELGRIAEPATPKGDQPAPRVAARGDSVEPVEPIAEDAVRDLFKRWLGAQNGGSFPDYAALYADKMEGIKRSGPRTRRYGRKGWLADRERMFKKVMTVAASEVKVSVAGTTAAVLFTQTWASGKYKDVGPKQLVLIKASEARGLRIVREEMLGSELQGAGEPGAELPLVKLAHVVASEGKYFVVLDGAPEGIKGMGGPKLISAGDPVVTAVDVKASAVPEPRRVLRGKPLQLYGAKGKVCKARVIGFALLGRITPHFGTREQWESGRRDPALRDSRVALEAWALTDGQAGGRVLAGVLGLDGGDCKGALLARLATGEDLEIAPAVDADKPLRALAMEALRKLPAHATVQKDYEATVKDASGAWDNFEGATPRVVLMRHKKSGKAVVAVTARAGVGCGEFEAELWGAWALDERGGKMKLKPLAQPKPWQLFRPEAALDLDGDGELELLIPGGLLRKGKSGYELWQRLQVPSLDCHC